MCERRQSWLLIPVYTSNYFWNYNTIECSRTRTQVIPDSRVCYCEVPYVFSWGETTCTILWRTIMEGLMKVRCAIASLTFVHCVFFWRESVFFCLWTGGWGGADGCALRYPAVHIRWWVVMAVRGKSPNGSLANRVFSHFRIEKIHVFFFFWKNCVPATERDFEIGLCMCQVVYEKNHNYMYVYVYIPRSWEQTHMFGPDG